MSPLGVFTREDPRFSVGDYRPPTPGEDICPYPKTLKTYFWRGAPELQNKLCYGQIVKAIAIAGNRVEIDMKLGVDFGLGLQPCLKVLKPIQNIGIEGITIDRKQTASGNGNQVRFSHAYNGYLRACETAGSWGPHIEIRHSRDLVLTENYIHDGYDNTGGMNYGINSQDSSTRIRATNNRIERCRHHLSMKEGANHCVYSYNTTVGRTSHNNFLVLHGNYCHNNLFEGNYAEQRGVIDGFHNREDRNNWFFRNHIKNTIGDTADHYISPLPAWVANETGGTVLSTSGLPSRNGTSFVGEFIAANIVKGAPQWGRLTSSSRIPASLYLVTQPSHVSKWPLYGPPTNMGATSGNAAPLSSAGPDRSLTLPAAASLDGTVTDDGLPDGSVLTQAWSQVSGPGTAVFADAAAVDTTATFSAAGTYVLRLTASDGALSASDTMQVVVLEPNDPPLADAGADQAIILPSGASLAGSASDDGRPGPLAVTWSKVSGPGTVTFQDAHALVTTAAFSTAGSYLLRLTASDGSLSATDTLTVTVAADPGGDVVPPPVPEAPELAGGSAVQPLLAGSTEAGALVAISDGGTQLATVIADAEGAWSWSPVSALATGSHSFTVTATDAAGNRSQVSAALVHLVPEPAAPAAPPAPTAASALPPPGESGGPGCGLGAGALACALVACALAGRSRAGRRRA